MKKITILLILFLFIWKSEAQEGSKIVQTIKGKVIDAVTSEPVSYTNIGLEGTFYGTASNAEGNFELKIPEELISKNIYFSAVGFKNEKFPVTGLFEKEFNVIRLEPQSYDIGDIDVAAQSKVLIRILRMAAENTPYNFIAGPFNLGCTYKIDKTVNDTVQTNTIAEVILFDKNGYSQPSKLDAFRSRKYSVKNQKERVEDYRFSTGGNNIDELLELDWVRSGSSVLNPALIPGFQLQLASEPVLDGREYWVISFQQPAPTFAGSGDFYAFSFEGEITVAKEDYSVNKITGKIRSAKNSLQGKSIAVGNSGKYVRENVSYDYSVAYKSLKPELIQLNKSYTTEGNKVSEKSELKVGGVQTTNVSHIESRDYFTSK